MPSEAEYRSIWMGVEDTEEEEGWFPVQDDVAFRELSIFEGKVTFGAIDRDSDDIISSWIISDLSGGGQIDRFTGADQSRFRHAILETEKPGAITLPMYYDTLKPSGATGTSYPAYQIGNVVCVIFGSKIYPWDESTDTWGTGVSLTNTTIQGKPTVFNSRVFIPNGSQGYTYITESAGALTQHNVSGVDGSGVISFLGSDPTVVDFEVWAGKIWALTTIGCLAWSLTGDSGSWRWETFFDSVVTAKPQRLDPSCTPTRLVTFPDNNGDPALLILTNKGAFRPDSTTTLYELTSIQFPPHQDFGRAAAVFRPGEDLYAAVGLWAMKYTTAGVVDPDVGLSRGDGMPFTHLGKITDFEAEPSRLYATVSGATSTAISYSYSAQFGSGPNTGNNNFDAPRGLAVDSTGDIIIVDTNNERHKRISSGLAFEAHGTGGDGGYATDNGAYDVAVTSANVRWVVDKGNHRVQKFNTSETYQSQIDGRVSTTPFQLQATYGSTGSDTSNYDTPAQVALDSSTNSYVADSANKRIIKRDSSGAYVSNFQPLATDWALQATYGTTGSGTSPNFDTPGQVTKDSSNRLWVADIANVRAVRLTSGGAHSAAITGTTGICGICLDSSDNVYVALTTGLRLYDSALNFLGGPAAFGTSMRHITTDNSNLFLVDTGGNKIWKRTMSGTASSSWGSSGSGNGQFSSPYGICYYSGELYVVDAGNNRVQVFNTSGTYQRQWTIPAGCRGVEVDSSGNIVVACFSGDTVYRYTTTGTAVDSFSQVDPEGITVTSGDVIWVSNATDDNIAKWDQASSARITRGVAVDASNDLYVTYEGSAGDYLAKYNSSYTQQWVIQISGEVLKHVATDDTNVYVTSTSNKVYKRLCSDGSAVTNWGSSGSGNGQFSTPWGIAYYNSEVYVVDQGNNRVQVFNTSGTYQRQWVIDASARGIASNGSGTIVVAEYGTDTVTLFGTTGTEIENFSQTDAEGVAVSTGDVVWVTDNTNDTLLKWDEATVLVAGSGNGNLSSPVSVDINRTSGTIYVSDTGNHRVQWFDSAGAYVGQVGSAGTGNGQFKSGTGPGQLAVNQTSGDFYVIDAGNYRVQQFTSAGVFVRTFGVQGTSNGQFTLPTAIDVHPVTGSVFVGDATNDNVQEFTSTGVYLRQFGASGTSNGEFTSISGMALNQAGTNLYVTDLADRLQSFDVSTSQSFFLARPSLHFWNGEGWHGAWELTDSDVQLTWACVTATTDDVDGYRLWVGSDDGNVYSFPLRRTFHNPRAGWQAGLDKFHTSGYLLTTRFDALMSGFYKKARKLVVFADNASPSEKITVSYRVDIEDDNWIALGEITTTGRTVLSFRDNGDGTAWGQQFNWIQFLFEFERGDDAYQTPILDAAVLNYTKVPQQAQTFMFTIPFPKKHWNGRDGEEIRQSLRTLLRADQYVKLVHQDQTYGGQLAAVAGSHVAGESTFGSATVNFIEIALD